MATVRLPQIVCFTEPEARLCLPGDDVVIKDGRDLGIYVVDGKMVVKNPTVNLLKRNASLCYAEPRFGQTLATTPKKLKPATLLCDRH